MERSRPSSDDAPRGAGGWLAPGDVVDGRFKIEALAGAGGMGTVFEATDLHTRRRVALKVVGTGAETRDARGAGYQRFAREARILSRLDHPGIVRYLAHGLTNAGEPYLAMQWLDAESLAARVHAAPLDVDEATLLVHELARALAYAHARGVVHRDVKPSNVLLQEGNAARPVLIDFGLAREESAPRYTATGAAIGTPGYMSPEQARGQRAIDARTDVFSLGCLFFRVLTGRVPFAGQAPLEILARILFDPAPRVSSARAGVPPAYDVVIAQLLAKEPDERPRDGGEVLRLLESLAVGRESVRLSEPRVSCAERKLVLVLAVAPGASGPAANEETTTNLSSDKTVREIVREQASQVDAHVECLADGSIVATIAMDGVATDAAARAARCALSLRTRLAGARIALAATHVAPTRDEGLGDALADIVHLLHAPRAADGAVRIDETTAGLLSRRFEVAKDESGFTLRGERAAHERPQSVAGREAPFAGRDDEVAELLSLVDACTERRRGGAALVLGEAGMGKSRLLDELARALARRPRAPRIWAARAERGAAPFAVARDLVAWAAGFRRADDARTRRAAIRAFVAEHVSLDRRAHVLAFLGELCGIEDVGEPVTALPAEVEESLVRARADVTLMTDRIAGAWLDLVAAAARRRPLLLSVDDVHHADLASRRLLEWTISTAADHGVVLVAAARPELAWSLHADVRRVLGPLSAEACRRLADAVLPGGAGAAAARDCGGHPLYLEELLRAAAAGPSGGPAPALTAMLEARIEALDPFDRRVLRAASAFDGAFEAAAIDALVGEDAGDALERLVERELLVGEGDGEYRFAQEMMRRAAYEGLTPEDRAGAHRFCAAWLERRAGVEPAVRARHLELSGDRAGAAAAYARAARDAVGANDAESALAHAEDATRLGAIGDALAVVAEVERWRGRLEEARRAAEGAQSAARPESAAWLDALALRCIVAAEEGDAEAASARAMELARAAGSSVEARARAVAALRGLAREDASAALEAALDRDLHAAAPSPSAEGFVHAAQAARALARGDLGACYDRLAASVAALGRTTSAHASVTQLVLFGEAMVVFGQADRAANLLRAAAEEASRLELPVVGANARRHLAVALARLGRFDDARDAALDAIDPLRAASPRLAAAARAGAARVLWLAGDANAAERLAEVAAQAAHADAATRALAAAVRADARAKAGDVSAAAALAREGCAALPPGDVAIGAYVRLACARALAAAGDDAASMRLVAEGARRLRELARSLRDDADRDRFLHGVPEHLAILRATS